MSMEKTLAICIRLVEFSESSYVTTLFTEDFGKITGLAKGARRPKSAFENALDLLAVSRVVFLRKSLDSMDLLTEARLETPFRPVARDLTCLYAGYYVAELLQAMTDEHDPHRELFRRARNTLAALVPDADIGRLVLRFELTLLDELGHRPSLADCVECGQWVDVDHGGRVAFGLLSGGVLCARCRIGKRQTASITRTARDQLMQIADDTATPNESCSGVVRGELRGLMNHYMSHVLGRRPRMHAFLSTLR